MTEHESALAGLYDHEEDAVPAGDRRRAADWGGDDLFTSMPRRRFGHAVHGADSERYERAARAVADRYEFTPGAGTDARRSGGARRPEPAPALVHRRETMEHPVQRSQRPPVPGAARNRSPLELPDVTERTVRLPEPAASVPAAGGRRTVTITGHPDRVPARRRPAPTLDERLYGSNPERIAMYAFALGLLLIVIAFISANA